MLTMIGRRVFSMIFVLFGVSFVTFIVGYLAPGNPVQILMGNRHDPALYQRLLHQYGFDQPWYTQYWSYISGVFRGDFGTSFAYPGTPVLTIIQRGLPVSLEIGSLALALQIAIGVPAGLLAALHRNTGLDTGIMGFMLLLYSLPSFILVPATLAIDLALYNAHLPWLPVEGWGSPSQLVMPLLVVAAGGTGYIARLTRASVLEEMGQDYVRTAHAKGLRRRLVTRRHVLRNGLIPVVTFIGPSIAFLVTGAFVVEYYFSIPGIGNQTIESISQRDFPVVQGTTILLASAVVVMNLLTDIAYIILDPRIQAQG